MGLGLAEQAQVHTVLHECLIKAGEAHSLTVRGVTGGLDGYRGAGGAQQGVHGQPQQSSGVQLELTESLARQGHQAGVMRAGRDLREEDLLPADEQLDAEQTPAAQRRGHGLGHLLGPFQGSLVQALWLPGLDVVSVDLPVPDRFAEARHRLASAWMTPAHREQSDLGVEADKALHNDPATVDPSVGCRIAPCRLQVLRAAHHRLAVARRRHDRLDHAREAHLLGACH